MQPLSVSTEACERWRSTDGSRPHEYFDVSTGVSDDRLVFCASPTQTVLSISACCISAGLPTTRWPSVRTHIMGGGGACTHAVSETARHNTKTRTHTPLPCNHFPTTFPRRQACGVWAIIPRFPASGVALAGFVELRDESQHTD